MARRKPHEEHANHEAWAIPYGDLVTLLLAFFVVMYSISTVNEGKYRVVSDSLNAAFRGNPSGPQPVQVGTPAATTVAAPIIQLDSDVRSMALRQMAEQAEEAMSPLIAQGLVDVQLGDGIVEIAIRSDILFTSGSALLADAAQPVIRQLGGCADEPFRTASRCRVTRTMCRSPAGCIAQTGNCLLPARPASCISWSRVALIRGACPWWLMVNSGRCCRTRHLTAAMPTGASC